MIIKHSQYLMESPMDTFPSFTSVSGSILHGNRYQLDGVIIYQRRGFNGLYVATNNYVEKMTLLEKEEDIKVYQAIRDPLRIVIVYTYSHYHTPDQAVKAFCSVLKKADQYGVKRLGMNALKIEEHPNSSMSKGEEMIELVKKSFLSLSDVQIESVSFIDSLGVFPNIEG